MGEIKNLYTNPLWEEFESWKWSKQELLTGKTESEMLTLFVNEPGGLVEQIVEKKIPHPHVWEAMEIFQDHPFFDCIGEEMFRKVHEKMPERIWNIYEYSDIIDDLIKKWYFNAEKMINLLDIGKMLAVLRGDEKRVEALLQKLTTIDWTTFVDFSKHHRTNYEEIFGALDKDFGRDMYSDEEFSALLDKIDVPWVVFSTVK